MTLADTTIQVSTLPELHLCLLLHIFTINYDEQPGPYPCAIHDNA